VSLTASGGRHHGRLGRSDSGRLERRQTLNRAQELLRMQSGPQSNVDSALSAERALAAQIVPNWQDAADKRFGFSTDPQVLPSAINAQAEPVCGLGNNTMVNPATTNPFCGAGTPVFVIEPNDSAGKYHWYVNATEYGAIGPGFTMTGTVNSSTGVVTGLSDTSKLVGGGSSVSWSGPAAAATGSCLTGTTYINTVDSGLQVTLSQAANTNGSCSLTFINPQLEHMQGLMRANNIHGPWTLYGPVTQNYFGGAVGTFSSYQRPVRLGTNNWYSFTNSSAIPGVRLDGDMTTGSDSGGTFSVTFTETTPDNGLLFQRLPPNTVVHLNTTIPTGYSVGFPCSTSPFQCTRVFEPMAWEKATVAGQDWICMVEDDRNVLISAANPAVVAKAAHGLNVNDPVFFETSGKNADGAATVGMNTVTGNSDVSSYAIGQEVNFLPNGIAVPLVSWPEHTYINNISSGPPYTLTMSNPALTVASGAVASIWSLPLPIMRDVTYYVKTVVDADHFTISATPGGAAISTAGAVQAGAVTMPAGGMYVDRVAMDSAMNVLTSPAPVRISQVYYGNFPGPQYLQSVSCHYENGIMTYYAQRGFDISIGNFGFGNGVPYESGNHLPYNNGGALCHRADYYRHAEFPGPADRLLQAGLCQRRHRAGIACAGAAC
jgi:hypothetical protein